MTFLNEQRLSSSKIVMGATFSTFLGISSNISTNYNRLTNTIQQTCNVTSSANTSNNNYVLNGDDGVTINTINIGSANCNLASVMTNQIANGTTQTNTQKPSNSGGGVPGLGVMASLGINFNVSTNISTTTNINSATCNAASSANFTNNNVIITNSKDVTFNTVNKSPAQCSLSATTSNMVSNTTGQASTISPSFSSALVGSMVAIAAIAMIGVVLIAAFGSKKSGNENGNNVNNSGNNNTIGSNNSIGNNSSIAVNPSGEKKAAEEATAKPSISPATMKNAAESGALESEAVAAVEADPELLLLAA